MFKLLRLILPFCCYFINLNTPALAADYDINAMLSRWTEQHRPCLDSYGRFPVTVDERFLAQRQPVLDEFVKLGYLSSEATTTDINHDPAKPKNIVNAVRYAVTDKGSGYPDNYFRCYGKYQIKSLGKTESIRHSGSEVHVMEFTYVLSDIPDWVQESERFILLSDNLYDDLYTLTQPGEGQAIIKKGKDGDWRLVKVNRRYVKVSEDKTTARNITLRKEAEESSYRSLIANENKLTQEEKLARYHGFLRRFPDSQYADTISNKYRTTQMALRDQRNLLRANEQTVFSNLVQSFAAAIDNKDQNILNALTIEKTAARKALKNRLFGRHAIGEVAMTSYNLSGKDNELVQIQIEGGLRMIRAKRIDDKWYVSGYSTMSNKWFKKRDS